MNREKRTRSKIKEKINVKIHQTFTEPTQKQQFQILELKLKKSNESS